MQNRNITGRQYYKRKIFTGFLAVTLFLAGCGADLRNSAGQGNASGTGSAASPTMGRYVEEKISALNESYCPTDLFPTDNGIYLVRDQGMDERLIPDNGEIKVQEQISEAFRPIGENRLVPDMAVAENGARIFEIVEEGRRYRYFMTPEGEMREWDHFADKAVTYLYGRDGYFYVSSINCDSASGYSTALCRVDTETGETEYLWDFPQAVTNLSVCGDYLFAGYYNGQNGGIMIYSISDRKQLEEDRVLTDALRKYLEDDAGSGSFLYLIMPSRTEDGIYVLTEEGVFHHVIYGTVMEQVIEGSLCSIGDISKQFVAMCMTEDETGDMPVFWLVYDSGDIVRFAYNADIPSVPDTLIRVYSLHNDNNVRQAVTGYQGAHPELYVQYEVGVSEEDGRTEEDALKSLAIRIATGDGPDVLVMDGIPYDSYVEKGILKDLTELYVRMSETENYFENVTDCFFREEKVYTLPTAFQFTILMGEAELIRSADDLEGFVSLLEEMKTDGTSKIGLLTEDRILMAMAMVSGGWIDERGELDREALSRFLTLCRRIYAADRQEMSEEAVQKEIKSRANNLWGRGRGAVYDFMNRNQLYWANTLADSYCYYQNPLFMGSMGGDILIELNYLLSELDFLKKDYRIFSDQGTVCIPVSMLAVNQASGVQEEAEAFVEYALSADFQKGVILNGVPVNKSALYDMEKANLSHRPGNYSTTGWTYGNMQEDYVVLEVEWAASEDFEKLNAILDSIDRVNLCDTMVYDTVMELGVSAVNGEKSIEETVDAIAKKVQLYLAE